MSCVGAETGRRRQNRKRLSSSSRCGGRFGQLPGGPQPRVIATGDEAEILKELAKIMNTVHSSRRGGRLGRKSRPHLWL